MPIEFIPENWTKWKDIVRCPIAWGEPGWFEWSMEDDRRLLLIALDRYAFYLINKTKSNE